MAFSRSSRPPPFHSGPIVLMDDADHSIACLDRILVQVRRGPMTVSVVETLVSFGRTMSRAQHGRVGLLCVLEADAPMPSAEVRKRQGEIAAEFLAHPSARAAVVIAGESALSSLKRSVARMIGVARPRQLQVFDTAEPAVVWMGADLDVNEGELRETVARLRRAGP